jgi:hypothetical protein
MDPTWGNARAVELLWRSATWLRDEARAGRWHTLLAPEIGGLSDLCGAREPREIAAGVLRDAPPEAFWAGAITNAPRESLVRRALPEREALDDLFPVYGDDVLRHVRSFEDSHIQLAIAGRIEEAWSKADSPLAKEECAATCGVNGDVAALVALIVRAEFPCDRWVGPAMVACVESYRRGDVEGAAGHLDAILTSEWSGCWEWTQLAAGFLGRVPWGGYPFPDY